MSTVRWENSVRAANCMNPGVWTMLQESDNALELKRELEQIAPMAIDWAQQESAACQLVWNLSRENHRHRGNARWPQVDCLLGTVLSVRPEIQKNIPMATFAGRFVAQMCVNVQTPRRGYNTLLRCHRGRRQ
jgi:hypothetical protein